jgi:hypothetical protein
MAGRRAMTEKPVLGHAAPVVPRLVAQAVSATANTVDHALLAETLDALKDLQRCPRTSPCTWTPATTTAPAGKRSRNAACTGEIAHRGTSAPIQVGRRWVIERTNSWLNDFGRLRRCTERRRDCVDAYLALAASTARAQPTSRPA